MGVRGIVNDIFVLKLKDATDLIRYAASWTEKI